MTEKQKNLIVNRAIKFIRDNTKDDKIRMSSAIIEELLLLLSAETKDHPCKHAGSCVIPNDDNSCPICGGYCIPF